MDTNKKVNETKQIKLVFQGKVRSEQEKLFIQLLYVLSWYCKAIDDLMTRTCGTTRALRDVSETNVSMKGSCICIVVMIMNNDLTTKCHKEAYSTKVGTYPLEMFKFWPCSEAWDCLTLLNKLIAPGVSDLNGHNGHTQEIKKLFF